MPKSNPQSNPQSPKSEFLVKYPQPAGAGDPTWQLVGDAYRDGDDLVVGLSREFPALTEANGRLTFRMILMRPKAENGESNDPILRASDPGERAVIRGHVAGVDTPVRFGLAFPNNGKTVTLVCDTLPPWQSCSDGGMRRILRIALERTPDPEKPGGAPTTGARPRRY